MVKSKCLTNKPFNGLKLTFNVYYFTYITLKTKFPYFSMDFMYENILNTGVICTLNFSTDTTNSPMSHLTSSISFLPSLIKIDILLLTHQPLLLYFLSLNLIS